MVGAQNAFNNRLFMTALLLTGAGFSNNWGGLLASDVSSFLMQIVKGNFALEDLLHNSEGFEDAYEKLKAKVKNNPSLSDMENLATLEIALHTVFSIMNTSYQDRATLNFSSNVNNSVSNFLANFDSIFTLNQDLLLELLYAKLFPIGHPKRKTGVEFVGVTPQEGWNEDPLNAKWIEREERAISHNSQPIYKLHGSINWVDESSGKKMMIIGTEKMASISSQPIIRYLNGEFFRQLMLENSKLMIIGYGFRDKHINNYIIDAYRHKRDQGKDLPIFVIHPDGRDYLKTINQALGGAIIPKDPIEELHMVWMRGKLSSTFSDDAIERQRLMEFFN
jgi:hypothetical protein